MADELSPRVLQFFGQQIRDRQAEEAAQRERARAAPPPAPAAPPTAPPAQPAARLRVDTSVMTPDELAAYCAEFGYELGEKPPANTLVRPWNNPDPLARRERVRKAEMNRIAIEQMRREKAATEAARIARLESMRKNVRHEPVGEIRAQVQRMGFDRTVIEGERAIGGLLDGITMIDPGDRMLPPPRVYGPTARDELEAAREQRRRQSSAPPPPMAGSRTYEEMLSDTLANETERPTDWSAAPPTTPPPQPVQPTTHAKNMSKEAFKALLSKFRI